MLKNCGGNRGRWLAIRWKEKSFSGLKRLRTPMNGPGMSCRRLPLRPTRFPLVVIPAKAGIQGFPASFQVVLDPRLRGDDGNVEDMKCAIP